MDDELTFRERKIIDDILSHLDGWRVNDHPKESRKVKNFLDPDDARPSNSVRKEVSSKEVLRTYEQAKIHALNYIRRNQFPKSPAIYLAICYWTAGLLSERVHFREDKVQSSYNLIEEARRLLSPYVRRSDDAFTISGDGFLWEEYFKTDYMPHPRRDRVPESDERVDEPKEPLTHGTFHRQPHPPKRPPCNRIHRHGHSPSWRSRKSKKHLKLKTDSLVSNDGETLLLKTIIKSAGKPIDKGFIKYYIYVDGQRILISTVPVIHNRAEYLWTIPEEVTQGTYKIYVAYYDYDNYLVCEGWENLTIKGSVSLVFDEYEAHIDKSISETQIVQLKVLVTDFNTLDIINKGTVHFLAKRDPDGRYVDIGEPVPVIDGVATLNYGLTSEGVFPIYVTAKYIENNEYAYAETPEPLLIDNKEDILLGINDVLANHGEQITISGFIDGFDELLEDRGYLSLYVDEEYIGRIDDLNNGSWNVAYNLDPDLVTGEHTLSVKYSGCEFYGIANSNAVLFIRGLVTVDNTPTFVQQTEIDENNTPLENNFPITTTVTNEMGNPVQIGMVTLEIQDYSETQNLDLNGQCSFSYHIDTTYHGGDIIPYILTYQENNQYSSESVESYVFVKYHINVEVDPNEDIIIDSPATLSASVTDENGDGVDTGNMLFGLEMGENNP